MSEPRHIIIAGAGIGGLTAALALARAGFRVTILEAAPVLEEVGAGLQLSPNATGVLLALGLGPALRSHVVGPEALRVGDARSGASIVEMPLGVPAAVRYGAPFWLIHRGDLQRVLLDAVSSHSNVTLHLGMRAQEFATKGERVVVLGRREVISVQLEGDALIAADGVWSSLRGRLHPSSAPRPTGRTAWRALLPADAVSPEARAHAVSLWLAPDAHVVHYPVRGGAAVNIVAIVRESGSEQTWSAPGDAAVLRAKAARWHPALRDLVGRPDAWLKWPLLQQTPLATWGEGAVTLLGDAVHAMQPFLAQGAGMAIEDAAVLAGELTAMPSDLSAAFRAYERKRMPRTSAVVAEAARTGARYGWRGPLAWVRNKALARMGGERLLTRYDWIYEWKNT